MTRRVLAIRPRALGDVVLSTAALRALKGGYPDAALEVVTDARYAPLVAPLPEVAHVWPLTRSTGATWRLASALRARRYEVAVDLFGNGRSAFLTFASGAPRTVGWDVRGRRYAYRVRVPRARPGGGREYAADAQVRVAVAAGGVADGAPPRLVVDPAQRAAADALLAAAGVTDPAATVGLVAAGTWGTKTWPLSHAASLARALDAAGWPVLALCGPGEDHVAAGLARMSPSCRRLPPCDVGTLVAVIERLAAVVGTDSGPRHAAAALGVPTFAWFGPTHPAEWSPPGEAHGYVRSTLPCRGCNRTTCPHWCCMPGLAPDAVTADVLDHLERHARPAARLGAGAGA